MLGVQALEYFCNGARIVGGLGVAQVLLAVLGFFKFLDGVLGLAGEPEVVACDFDAGGEEFFRSGECGEAEEFSHCFIHGLDVGFGEGGVFVFVDCSEGVEPVTPGLEAGLLDVGD